VTKVRRRPRRGDTETIGSMLDAAFQVLVTSTCPVAVSWCIVLLERILNIELHYDEHESTVVGGGTLTDIY
jgi:hypothetical protein